MHQDIIIIREGNAYRLLHGHLRLSNLLGHAKQVCVEVKGEGKVTVVKTGTGYLAGKDVPQLPVQLI